MRFSCVVAVVTTVSLLAGCLVARAAPRRSGGSAAGTDRRWRRNFSPEQTGNLDEDFDTNRLVQRVLNRLQQRLTGVEFSGSWDGKQDQQLDRQRYDPTDQEDAFIAADEVPNRPAIKRKCLGRFQPYAMNC